MVSVSFDPSDIVVVQSAHFYVDFHLEKSDFLNSLKVLDEMEKWWHHWTLYEKPHVSSLWIQCFLIAQIYGLELRRQEIDISWPDPMIVVTSQNMMLKGWEPVSTPYLQPTGNESLRKSFDLSCFRGLSVYLVCRQCSAALNASDDGPLASALNPGKVSQ